MARAQILVQGIVQGVGFRPYIYTLAQQRALKGRVFNDASGVVIDLEGERELIEQFVTELKQNPPPLSQIENLECQTGLAPLNYQDFRIVESVAEGKKVVPISADVATCQDCLRELFHPQDRRFRYPFINCTNCGPRFTIIEGVPYDREQTTMRDFEMCARCRSEYQDPADRRFHAEPTACPICGPGLCLTDPEGRPISLATDEDEVLAARRLIVEGKIVAIKGLGGFHLACDALNVEAVETLRKRKYREDKPFALMAGSIEVVQKFCLVSPEEEKLLVSRQRPIVLLERKPGTGIPDAVAPGVRTLGLMLPYTPLHHLLFENLTRPLVMTSGNISDEPICFEDGDAQHRLYRIADFFLVHNRRIKMRADDSVIRVHAGKEMVLRRSRGYAPAPLRLGFKARQQILACGAELKNTFCLARDNFAFISHHIGDLENLETLQSFTEGIEHFKRLFDLKPEITAYDLHPEYLSTKYALALDDIPVKVGVQHHHAHIASCLADNFLEGEVIGVALDGLGFGTDGRLWGGEFLVADFVQSERMAHLAYTRLPGGTKAIREPWRMAAMYLHRTYGDDFLNLNLPLVENLDRKAWPTLKRMITSGINSPETSSMGRLFDAVASLIGLRTVVNYEGQAAIELEAMADTTLTQSYLFEIAEDGVIHPEPVIRRVVDDLLNGCPAPEVSAKFHLAVSHLICDMSLLIRDQKQLYRVALSGGVFQNLYLLKHTCRLLKAAGFEVFTHSRVPANDGGISLGQAAVAHARLSSGS